MTDYFVSPSGNNGNGLSLANAKTTGVAGAALLSGGDRLLIDDGTYTDYFPNSFPSGSVGAPTIIKAINPNAAIFRPSVGGDNGIIQLTNRNYIDIDGLYLDGINTSFNDTAGIWLTGTSTHVNIKNGTVINVARGGGGGNGIFIQDSECDSVDIYNMLVKNNGVPFATDPTNAAKQHGIYIRGQNTTIRYSIFDGNSGYGIHKYSENWTTNGCIIYKNIIRNNVTRGVILSRGATIFYNNIIHGNARGVELDTGGQIVYENTIYNNPHNAIWAYGGLLHLVKNNILYSNNVDDIVIDSPATVTQSNNLKGTDPKFVNAGTSDFRLLSTSPAITYGTALGSPYDSDFRDISRPQGAGWDAGAYEFDEVVSSEILLALADNANHTIIGLRNF